ncbi:TIGR03757 family integrating conjugative element protein [Acidomonas methanolica]|uniref:Integrating conjugative element protein n=1 Tax=Acidomonas methanolica NBRC 104435 TaxID=1231351 RepID=A0A023D587_ACIMT|nr:TIGR03757 family integrating conjugative element protein [Acidomonas methanolica]MBU2654916.1 TIGR03757 family integrating conjugative element protein [Acidomonas methanolica]TCS29460.1 integrating conjugative element protein (TIGR03757 family) [Acidomonas methanolica]GAJ29302.1 hypothetical protein Amme_059_021 [Acidomonas methanolica NBRC 104435]GBQ45637.1 hypothetical protein AA0498_0103 [Acidomonas methanolica]GEK99066.1 integrating conjugative element protein [Acidomonas methanolica NB
MRTPSHFPHRLRPSAIAIVAVTGFALCNAAARADALVVTDSRHPVQTVASVPVLELDAPTRIEANLARNLPSDPEQAAALIRLRLHDDSPALQQELASAYRGVATAFALSITKLPAVVVDHRYVVYGDPDVGRAIAHIARYRDARP